MKKMNRTLFFSVKEQSLETRKLWKLLVKEEEEVEVQRDVHDGLNWYKINWFVDVRNYIDDDEWI